MKNVLRNALIIEATIVSVCMWSIPSAVKGQNNILTLLRKIQVDHQGTAGACDGSAFSTSGDIIAASDNTGLTKLFNVADGALVSIIQHNESEVSAKDGETNVIHFTPDDRYAVTGMNETGAKIWNLETGEMVKNLGVGQNTDGAAFSPDGKWIAVAHDNFCAVYALWDYTKVAEYSVLRQEVNAVDWSEDGSHLMIGGDAHGVKIVRTTDWELMYDIKFPTHRVKSVAISPDGRFAAACGQNGLVCVYNTMNGATVTTLRHNTTTAKALPGDDDDGDEPNVEAIEWSTDSRYFFTGGTYDGIIRIWRVADWSMIGWVQGQEYSRQVETLSMSKDNILASGGDEGFVYLFQFNPPVEKDLIQQNGNDPVVIEAEDFDANVAQGSHWWSVIDDETASGGKKVQALPDGTGSGHGMDVNFQTGDPTKDSPKLDYRVNITRPGTYYVWTRAQGVDHYANSYHIGLNGHPVSTADRMENLSDEYEWIWSNDTKDRDPATLVIPTSGPVTLNLWMREDGIEVDKIILTTQKDYVPNGHGPEPDDR